MLSSSGNKRLLFALAQAAVLGFLMAVSGCQVRPLYSAGAGAGSAAAQAANLSVSVGQVNTRYAQEVRNHLIFLLNGGAAEPAGPAYKLDIGVTKRTIQSVEVQTNASGENQPTAGGVVLESSFSLQDAASGETVSTGSRSVTSSFDRPRQQFAQLRAERDAEDRAARELAELLRLAVAAELAKR